MTPDLKPGEKIEDLQYKGLRIIQNESGFRFGTDSVLLAGFVKAGPKDSVIDLGSGTGVIAMLVEARTGAKVTALELQPEQCDMARRSISMNGLDIEVVEADMRTAHESLGRGRFSAAVCNPPYYPAGSGEISGKGESGFEGAATHDLFCTMSEVASSAARLIKYGGRFFICCPTSRLAEAITALSNEKLTPKRLRLVAVREDKAPYLALIEAKKGGAPGLKAEKQLVLCNQDGSYTEEANAIYHRTDA
ncbi:MAG: methyltransferase [Clostridiales bacterium]|nr:methyltransferase [Clostridiales bacterium]